ncbi:TrgA family protein [Falsihalocynthiibacter sp. SS001]|uniref:TrgA family protein n=1 Tax=Falsihalocynthiibacter sp. SS001 TaxID=3349698 RepID=UPI0036D26A2E
MLTASRVVGGIAFAFVTWFACEFIKFTLPEDTNPRQLSEVSALVGFILGWRIAGPHQREGYRAAISTGFTTAIAIAISATLLLASIKMVRLSLRKSYDGATEAVIDMFRIAGEYALIAATPYPIGMMVCGGIVAGMLVEWSSRRWN